jgi:uncharacterized protein (TIGR02391 family)
LLKVFDPEFTEQVCNVLAQTKPPGLSESELLSALIPARLSGMEEGSSKRNRLLRTLHNAQVERRQGDTLVVFINAALNPGRYTSEPNRFHQLRDQLNVVLALYGYRVNEKGQFANGPVAQTLDEASRVAGELFMELRRRECHPALLLYASEELVRKSLFHAMSEASKSIPDRLRRHTGLGTDGEPLYGEVFGTRTSQPLVSVTACNTESEISEQRGFKTLLTGIHGHYRNPRAHGARINAAEDKQDFYDAFSLFSYVHRRLDRAGVSA